MLGVEGRVGGGKFGREESAPDRSAPKGRRRVGLTFVGKAAAEWAGKEVRSGRARWTVEGSAGRSSA